MATKGQDVNVVTILHATKSKSSRSRGQVEAAGQLVAARKAALLQQVHATGGGGGELIIGIRDGTDVTRLKKRGR